MGVYIKSVTAKEINDLFDEYGIWWIEPDDVIDIEEAQPDMQSVKADRKTEPNLILPERMERGERFEVGETIVVMNREDYYDLLCKSWKDESHTDTHDEAIKAMATLIKAKTEPQTEAWHDDCNTCRWHACTIPCCDYEPMDEPQTEETEMDEYYKDHDEFYDCDRYVVTNDEGERAYNCIGCQTDCSWR